MSDFLLYSLTAAADWVLEAGGFGKWLHRSSKHKLTIKFLSSVICIFSMLFSSSRLIRRGAFACLGTTYVFFIFND